MKLYKIFFAIAILLLICNSSTLAQNAMGTIRGEISDSSSKEKISFATISLVLDSSKQQRSTLSRENGQFLMEKIPFGKHQLIVLNVGYKKYTKTIEISAQQPLIDLGNISLAAAGKQLNEVEVSTEKALVKQEVDRISYDVQSDPESKFQTALDMLRKVPLVTVDADDNIQVKGSSNFRVLINGRPSSLVARSPKDVFRAMPASSIVKIEVITNPPAKYDADGLAGIINVITNQKMESGYNANVGVRYSFPWGPGVNASLTLKKDKLALTSYYGTGYGDVPATSFSSVRNGFNPNTVFIQVGTNDNSWNWHYLSNELSYEFDSLNLLTAEIGWNPGSGTRFTEQTALMYGETGNLDQSYHLIDDGNNSWNALDLGLNFQRGFKAKKDQLLTLSYKYSPNVNDDYNEVFTDQSMNFFFVPFQQKNRSGSVEQTAQLDYVHPVKKVDIEAGLKGILRNNFSKYEYLNQDPLTGDFLLDSIRSNEFDYQQNVFSFYNSYNVKFETWSVRAGLRIEKTIVDANFKTTATTVEQNYENFIPSIAIQKKFKNMSSLNLGYTQRIERPSIWQLNPFVYQNDPRNISTGNPQLEAVLTNNFEIGYSTFKKGSINVGASYSFANNTIQNVTILDTDSVSKSSFLNIGEDKKLGINANVSLPINKKINININSQLSYLWLEGSFDGRDYTNQGFQGNAFAFVSYTLPKEYRLRVSGGYYSPYIQLQGQSNNYVYSSVSVSKDFFDKKLTASVNCSNPFQKFRNWEQDFAAPEFQSRTIYQNYYRSFGFNLSYRFGKLEGGVKKNQRGINNDDTQQKGSSQGGS